MARGTRPLPASRSSTNLHLYKDRSAAGAEPAERRAPGPHGYGHLCAADGDAAGARTHGPDARRFLIELHSRFSLSRGLPGADAGGRSAGRRCRGAAARAPALFSPFCWSSLLLLSSTGIALGRQDKLSRFWRCGRPICFLPAVGQFSALADGHAAAALLSAISAWTLRRAAPSHGSRSRIATASSSHRACWTAAAALRRLWLTRVFPRILDEYVMREFFSMFVLVLAGFVC